MSMGGTVPLSEHEQRQLEQIEQALYADHPRLARIMRAKDPRVHYGRRVREASVGFLIGVAALVAGLFLKYSWLSAAGLVVMLLSLGWAVASIRRRAAMVTDRKRGRNRGRRSRVDGQQASSGLMERLEERWRRRQEGNNR
jgi:Protein of unknown function (DUF3040)